MTTNKETRPSDPRVKPDRATATIVILFNSVAAGLGGLYVGTRSITVTVLAAALVAVLALMVALLGKE